VFERLTGVSPRVKSLIAVIATLNGIIVQVILAARVLYGLARQGTLPAPLGQVSPTTHTPLLATALVGAIVLTLALLLPLERLADLTSRFTLILFALVNLALIRIKAYEGTPPRDDYVAPRWVPWAGFVSCVCGLPASRSGDARLRALLKRTRLSLQAYHQMGGVDQQQQASAPTLKLARPARQRQYNGGDTQNQNRRYLHRADRDRRNSCRHADDEQPVENVATEDRAKPNLVTVSQA
jgi:hypothetical protein